MISNNVPNLPDYSLYQRNGRFEVEVLNDNIATPSPDLPAICSTPSGSPIPNPLPPAGSDAVHQESSSQHVHFNPVIVAHGIFPTRVDTRQISLADESSYLSKTGFHQDPVRRRLVGRPSDTYDSELARLKRRALSTVRAQASRGKIVVSLRRMNRLNQATETFTRQEMLDLLESASRLKDEKMYEWSTREIIRRFRKFARLKSTFPSSAQDMSVYTPNRGKHFRVSYENIPREQLEWFETNQLLEHKCFRGNLDDLIPMLKAAEDGSMVIVSSDSFVEDLGGYIGVTLSVHDNLKAYHWHIGNQGEAIVTKLFKKPSTKQIYSNLQDFLSKISIQKII